MCFVAVLERGSGVQVQCISGIGVAFLISQSFGLEGPPQPRRTMGRSIPWEASNGKKPLLLGQADVHDFELWRWFFFFGGLAPIWWFGDFVVRLLVFLVESAFLNTKNVMYFLVAIRVSFLTTTFRVQGIIC